LPRQKAQCSSSTEGDSSATTILGALDYAQGGTIRLKLLRIDAVTTRDIRRIRSWFSSAFLQKDFFKFDLICFYGQTHRWCWPRRFVKIEALPVGSAIDYNRLNPVLLILLSPVADH
jgi:hypothetical protein